MKNKLVIAKDNKLIQKSAFTLSLAEQRVILLCLAKWNSQEKIPDNREFIVSVDDFYSDLEVSRESAYRDLRVAVNKLYEQNIYLDPNNPESKMRWLAAKVHRKDKGEISLYFSTQIIPYISELKNCFTRYKLKDVAKFESSYSFRFYELLASWEDRAEIKIAVSWIREALQLEDKYPAIADLKKNVIVPALADINNFSNLSVALPFKQIKKGNVITHFVFKYAPKPGENNPEKINKAYILKHARPGETWEQASNRLRKNCYVKNNT